MFDVHFLKAIYCGMFGMKVKAPNILPDGTKYGVFSDRLFAAEDSKVVP